MGSKSDYAENKVLELLVGKTAFTKPTAYVALYTAAPSDSGGGTEVTGGSYARVATAGTDWNAAASGFISNVNDLLFPTPTAAWGTVVAFALYDASSGGNELSWGLLTNNKTIGISDPTKFPGGTPGSLVLTED